MNLDLRLVLEKLPPFSPAKEKLLSCLQKETVNIAEVEKLLFACPVIAGRVLQIANSSFYGFSREITSLREAYVIMGQQTVQNLVYTMVVIDQFSGDKNPGTAQLYTGIWLHSLYSACMVKVLAKSHKLVANDLFTAALFQHLGLLIMFHCFPEHMLSIQATTTKPERLDLIRHTEQITGLDYRTLSSRTLEHWRFPVVLCNMIDPNSRTHPKEQALLQLGNCLADAQGFTLIPERYLPLPVASALGFLPSEPDSFGLILVQTDALLEEMRQCVLS